MVYKRLWASAGRPMTDSIIKRIETANVVIIDITNNNKNVFIELGMALFFSKNNPEFSLYLIKEKIEDTPITCNLPTDLQGYFISEYIIEKNGAAKFKDNNSLFMSIVSDINDFYNKSGLMIEKIDEINFEE